MTNTLLAIWVVQIGVAIVLATISGFRHQWFAAAGVIVGIGFGFLPLYMLRGPKVWAPLVLMAAVSAFGLAAYYCITKRWKRFATVVLLVGIPLSYTVSYSQLVHPNWWWRVGAPIGVVGDLAILSAPILCALAVRAFVGELDRLRLHRGAGDHPA